MKQKDKEKMEKKDGWCAGYMQRKWGTPCLEMRHMEVPEGVLSVLLAGAKACGMHVIPSINAAKPSACPAWTPE